MSHDLAPPTPSKQATYDPMFWKNISPPEAKADIPTDFLMRRPYPEAWDLIPKNEPKLLRESDHYKQELKELNIDPHLSSLAGTGFTILLLWIPITVIAILTSTALGGWGYTIVFSITILVVGVSILAYQLRKDSKNMNLKLKPILEELIEAQLELENLAALEGAAPYVTHERFQVENSSTEQVPTT